MGGNKITALLLTLSLALNLSFLAAIAYRKLHRRPPAPPTEFISDFNLAPAQETKVREIVRKFKINSILHKEDILDKRVEIVEELGNPLYDKDQISKKTEELNKLENLLNRDFIAALLKISDVLEPEQRLDMIYHLSRNWFFFERGSEKGGPHE
jgi:Spy/CpxP family protein refolding chaperone